MIAKGMNYVFGLALLAISTTATVQAEENKALYNFVHDNNQAIAKAILEGDADFLSSGYTDDSYLMAPDTPLLRGPAGAHGYWQAVIDSKPAEVKLVTTEVHESGDLAYGTGTLAVTAHDGKVYNSNYVLVFKKIGGEWRLHLDIWTPTPAAGK
ncbi:YybH family protein [Kordiimonas laminariae]|uniref:YybH family protein n=1 Tax=Kordiimonas laminariae TaxID=2917717 RepID=UPI001FF288D6|nr:DUF4440 domain-containing protein [Kordiimonas laminariae]MCK0070601.1 DUF4440 domain-containing protein [Kordiimonas laminariae]